MCDIYVADYDLVGQSNMREVKRIARKKAIGNSAAVLGITLAITTPIAAAGYMVADGKVLGTVCLVVALITGAILMVRR